MNRYRIFSYKTILFRVAIKGFLYLVLFKILLVHAFSYQTLHRLSISLDIPFFVILIIPFTIVVSAIFLIASILYAFHLLSYSVIVTNEGKIIESQAGVPQRAIDVKDILEIDTKWLDIYPAENSLVSKIPGWIRDSFIGGFLPYYRTVRGFEPAKSMQFINNIYTNFPRYSVHWKILNDLRVFRSDLTVKKVSEERILTQQTIFPFSAMVLFICLTLIFFSIGAIAAFSDSKLAFANFFNIFILIGIFCIFGAVYYWRQRYIK